MASFPPGRWGEIIFFALGGFHCGEPWCGEGAMGEMLLMLFLDFRGGSSEV